MKSGSCMGSPFSSVMYWAPPFAHADAPIKPTFHPGHCTHMALGGGGTGDWANWCDPCLLLPRVHHRFTARKTTTVAQTVTFAQPLAKALITSASACKLEQANPRRLAPTLDNMHDLHCWVCCPCRCSHWKCSALPPPDLQLTNPFQLYNDQFLDTFQDFLVLIWTDSFFSFFLL